MLKPEDLFQPTKEQKEQLRQKAEELGIDVGLRDDEELYRRVGKKRSHLYPEDEESASSS